MYYPLLLRQMDPLSAVSVAAAVIQFVEFGRKVVSKGSEIYNSVQGASIDHVQSEAAARNLVQLNEALKASLHSSRCYDEQENEAIRDICNGCISTAKELIARFNKLRVGNGQTGRRWKSLRQALKSVWSKGEIDAVAARLEAYRRELDTHVLVSLRLEPLVQRLVLAVEIFTHFC